MSQQLINHSPDLKRLREEGYDIEVRSGHLLLKSVPYLDLKRQERRGTLVSPLGDVSGDVIHPPSEHTAFFQGDHPCRADGTKITQIEHSSETKTLAKGVVVNHMFSAMPKEGKYRDYHHKMTTYVSHISLPVSAINPDATAQTGMIVEPPQDASPFNYLDTASPRAGISAVTEKLCNKKIAIVGLGGTGSYILDLVAKTPVTEIHLFDGDVFSNHNSFRAPGAPSIDELRERPLKVNYLADRYLKMHRKIIPHDCFIDGDNANQLDPFDFIFLAMDRGDDKRQIVERMEQQGKLFIDVGMGVDLASDELRGILRVTSSTPQKRDHFRSRVPFSDGGAENDYSRNIQIADLNALNAALAVIKWKKLAGFYQDLEKEHCCAYTINGNTIANEDQRTEN